MGAADEPGATAQRSRIDGHPRCGSCWSAVFLAGVAAIVIARWWTGTGYQEPPLGLPDAGGFTAIGLPIAQFVHDMAGIAVVGLLFVPVRCMRVRVDRRARAPAPDAMAARWAWVWAGSTLAWIVLTMSDLVGLPVGRLPERARRAGHRAGHRSGADADRHAVGCRRDRAVRRAADAPRRDLRRPGAGDRGAAAQCAHRPCRASQLLRRRRGGLAVHIAAPSLWVGGLLALVVHLRAFPDQLQQAVPRFSAAACSA